MFFQQANMNITVPLVDNYGAVLDKNPIMKLKVLDMTSSSSSSNSSNVTFTMEEKVKFLQLDQITGQLWFSRTRWTGRDVSTVVISAERADTAEGSVPRVTVNVRVMKAESAKAFCENSLCFYDAVTYHVIEDYAESAWKAHEIGEMAPKFYGRICKKYQVEYSLLNGKLRDPFTCVSLSNTSPFTSATEYVGIRANKLHTIAPLNYEGISPGPELKVAVQCTVKMGSTFIQNSIKVFNITVIDRNDNLIRVQDNHKVTNLTLDSPYFTQVGRLSFMVITISTI